MSEQFEIKSAAGWSDVAKCVRERISSGVLAIYGPMGAGKTTFVKHYCELVGVLDEVSSPTFSLIQEYHTDGGESIFHFDFYRIHNEEEAYDIGTEDYFYSGSICLVEWPERIPSILPGTRWELNIQLSGETRFASLTKI